MGLQIGDTIWGSGGRPAIVTDREAHTGKLTVDPSVEKRKEVARHGYVNGLKTEDRVEFNRLLDEVRELGSPAARIEALQKKIDSIAMDPKQLSLCQYLKAELTHLMATHNVQPRNFRVDEIMVPQK